jgi:hypothetical protein
MKLYVCWGTFPTGVGPDFVHIKTAGRKEVERISGKTPCPSWPPTMTK